MKIAAIKEDSMEETQAEYGHDENGTILDEEQTFEMTVTMRKRWVPHFLAMMKHMEYLGNIGSSRTVTILADGDGDFRPKFEWDEKLPSDAEPCNSTDNKNYYDAG